MHRLVIGLFVTALLGSAPAHAADGGRKSSLSNPSGSAATLVEGGYYTNHDGQSIHRPAHTTNGAAPAGASAQCRDGTWSFSASRRGTCSHHGGVSNWL
ncbi:DUF3761 domain-containing protein [Luteibacter sp. CQ10]|uniref:DUF3761 domain-containing protein n=1 Tax=Luteibacter sp. CQ10 TaxID=2805821 RepID=UPI0034A36C37